MLTSSNSNAGHALSFSAWILSRADVLHEVQVAMRIHVLLHNPMLDPVYKSSNFEYLSILK